MIHLILTAPSRGSERVLESLSRTVSIRGNNGPRELGDTPAARDLLNLSPFGFRA